jgi:two-component system sensor histidine kinase KdpD
VRHGAGTITVGARKVAEAVEVEVTDEGKGIGVGDQPEAFGTLVQHADRRGGGGMGLAICRAIVEAHGGTIRADRTPSGTSRLVFTLPLGSPPRAALGAGPSVETSAAR